MWMKEWFELWCSIFYLRKITFYNKQNAYIRYCRADTVCLLNINNVSVKYYYFLEVIVKSVIRNLWMFNIFINRHLNSSNRRTHIGK